MTLSSNKNNLPVIAITGRPNVGKSTFFNRITGKRDALVDATPGMTRDRRYSKVTWQGHACILVDAGGLENMGKILNKKKKASIEGMVTKNSLMAIKEADLVIFMLDGREGVTPDDHEVASLLRSTEKPVITVINKLDSPAHDHLTADFWQLGFDKLLPISAGNGRGVAEVMALSLKCLETSGRIALGCALRANEKTSGADAEPAPEKNNPIRIAIAGRPNAGKSSLLNALVRDERMIVSDIPGTTRDSIDTLLERKGERDVILTDTAGIRRKSKVNDRVEKFSALKALDAVRISHITLVILDAAEGITDQDKRIIGFASEHGRACITIFNKWDLIKNDKHLVKLRLEELKRAKKFISYSPHINISALTGRNIEKILPIADNVYRDFSFKAGTGHLNRLLKAAVARRSPPISKGHHIKFFYVTQMGSSPPAFVIFVNYPEYIPEHYRRFLANHFREGLEITLSPVKIMFRKRERRT